MKLATEEFRDQIVTERESWILDNKDKNPESDVEQNAALIEPGLEFATDRLPARRVQGSEGRARFASRQTHGNGAWKKKLMINDRIADSIFQQVVTRADEYWRSGHAEPEWRLYFRRLRGAGRRTWALRPERNIGDGYAVFEATHGTAPKYADKDVINPGSVILSGVMMFDFLGWKEAARDD